MRANLKPWLANVASFAVGGPIGFAALQALRAYRLAQVAFQPHRQPFTAPQPVEGLQTVQLEGGIVGSFVPPRNGTSVVLVHGSCASRAQLWPEFVALTEAGFGALAFDWPGHGESSGEITFAQAEQQAFGAAVDYLASRSDRIGAFGFSIGAGLAVLYSAHDSRVSSLVCVGAWTDALAQTRYEFRRWGFLRQWPAVYATQRALRGNLQPLDVASKLRGRKTVFIAAENDDVVPISMSKQLAEAASGQFVMLPGRSHDDFHHPTVTQLLRDTFASDNGVSVERVSLPNTGQTTRE